MKWVSTVKIHKTRCEGNQLLPYNTFSKKMKNEIKMSLKYIDLKRERT